MLIVLLTLVPFQLAPSVLVGTGSNLQDSGESSVKTVETIRYKGGNRDSKREEKNRTVTGGKGRNKQFFFKTGTLGWESGNWVSFRLCLPLSDCGNEDKPLNR